MKEATSRAQTLEDPYAIAAVFDVVHRELVRGGFFSRGYFTGLKLRSRAQKLERLARLMATYEALKSRHQGPAQLAVTHTLAELKANVLRCRLFPECPDSDEQVVIENETTKISTLENEARRMLVATFSAQEVSAFRAAYDKTHGEADKRWERLERERRAREAEAKRRQEAERRTNDLSNRY